MWNATFWEGNNQRENETGLGSDMSVSSFKEGKSYSIFGIDFEISEHPAYKKNIFASNEYFNIILIVSFLNIQNDLEALQIEKKKVGVNLMPFIKVCVTWVQYFCPKEFACPT